MTAPTRLRGVPIDPRLAARRREIRRRQGRQRRRRLVGVLGVGGVAAATWGIALSPAFDVDRVVVRGATNSGEGTLEAAAGIDRGQAMVTLDLGATQEALEASPWVASASVRRSWPGTVVVSVDERRPVAAVRVSPEPVAGAGAGTAARWAVVDAEGRQLVVVADEAPTPLARIEGLAADGQPGRALGRAASGALELAARLSGIVPDPPPRITVLADGRLEATIAAEDRGEWRVLFGHPDHLDDKARSLVTLLERGVLGDVGASVIDLRVPDAPVLT